MAATRAERERWQADLDALLATDFRRTSGALHKLYAELLRGIKEQLKGYVESFEGLSYSKRLEVNRLFLTAQDLTKALGGANDIIGAHAMLSGAHGYAGVWYAAEQVAGISLASMGLDQKFLAALVREPVAGASLSQRLYRDRRKLASSVNGHIARGITEGRSYAEIARRVTETTEASYRQSLRIARTEAGRVRSEATQEGYEDAAKTVPGIGKRWVATLDGKTRDDHRYLDGQVVPHDEDFIDLAGNGAEGPRLFGIAAEDINCRCSTEPIIDGEGSALRLDNTTGDAIEYQSYAEWAEKLVG